MKITKQKNLHPDSYQDRKTNKRPSHKSIISVPGKKLNHFFKKAAFSCRHYLTAIGGNIYFSGYTYRAGQELYTGSTSAGFTPVQTVTTSALIAQKMDETFWARLLTNPLKDQLKFTVNVKDQQAAQVVIMDASGRILSSEKQTLSAGTNMFSYDTKAWTQGMYMIRIVTADGSSSLLKAVK